ncbi:hypothetical protein GCM10023065_28060 [Microbacterium laevaniformans]|nr:hypothetical protein GCM10017578_12110 [Microbacterium laevaniformans]
MAVGERVDHRHGAGKRPLQRAIRLLTQEARVVDEDGPGPTHGAHDGGHTGVVTVADAQGRNVIERRYCHIKQWRGLATRYDKLAITYRAAVILNAVIAWTRQLSDMP